MINFFSQTESCLYGVDNMKFVKQHNVKRVYHSDYITEVKLEALVA